ncbi:MAG: protein O-GlcNAc transferase [Pirellulaceae bacterium]|jgi:protein O-GlcNAc transferase
MGKSKGRKPQRPKWKDRARQRQVEGNAGADAMAIGLELAESLLAAGKSVECLEVVNQLLEMDQPTAATWKIAGKVLISVKEYAQAIDVYSRAVDLDADDIDTRFNLAGSLYQMGEVSRASEQFAYVADRYGHLNAWCNLATILPGCPLSDHQRVLEVRQRFVQCLQEEESVRLTDPLPPANRTDGRLRVGYISAYFKQENYMKPVWSLINGHDRSRYEVHLFADNAQRSDFEWLEGDGEDRVHLTDEMDNLQLAQHIRAADLDLLVDLNAYSIPTRLPLFVHRLARHTLVWFNMYATSALPEIDWIVGDRFVIREEEEQFYTENVARLDTSYLTFQVRYGAPDVVPPPCIANGHFTFGSLISQYKVTPEVIETWARILNGANNSRLVLANRMFASACNRDYVLDRFEQQGVARGRVDCLPPAEHREFLKYYDKMDLALDAFPYNGGTTTTEAIWQGVPVLAIDGDRWASRTSRTLLMNCHLQEFVATDIDDYVRLAVQLANDPEFPQRLSQLRREMREKLLLADVCDAEKLVRSMESIFAAISGGD